MTDAYAPHAGDTIDYSNSQAQRGKALAVYYDSTLASQSSVDLHWGYNTWSGVTDTEMVKRSEGIWQATIPVPTSATIINLAFNNNNDTWDNNNTSNYSIAISANSGSPALQGGGSGTTTTHTYPALPAPLEHDVLLILRIFAPLQARCGSTYTDGITSKTCM